jgi:hypothetical protein
LIKSKEVPSRRPTPGVGGEQRSSGSGEGRGDGGRHDRDEGGRTEKEKIEKDEEASRRFKLGSLMSTDLT